MTRTFIAVDLSEGAREVLQRYLSQTQRALPDVRLTASANLHLTLAFLGELDDDALATVIALTEGLARQTAPFHLELGRLGVFGPPTAPRVLWAGVGGETASLLAVQRRLAEALEAQGYPREQRPFAPHLTLARLNRPLDESAYLRLRALREGPATRPTRWPVADLRVMRSELLATGAQYTALSVARLTGAAQR